MLDQIRGLHHVTSMARDARQNNDFFTHKLGLRRVKKTVNFDAPDVYHLYYGDEVGTPGSVMTYFPFPNIGKGRHGVGEVGTTVSPGTASPGSSPRPASAKTGCCSTGRTATASPSSRSGTTAGRRGRMAACPATRRSAAFIRPRSG
jgi:catechol 2,3-dioxygenase-like lactoylglutathione lyase family enzyme